MSKSFKNYDYLIQCEIVIQSKVNLWEPLFPTAADIALIMIDS